MIEMRHHMPVCRETIRQETIPARIKSLVVVKMMGAKRTPNRNGSTSRMQQTEPS